MADYNENVDRIVSVGWPSGIFQWASFSSFTSGGFAQRQYLVSGNEGLGGWFASWDSGKRHVKGQDTGYVWDWTLTPSTSTFPVFAAGPKGLPHPTHIPLYDEDGAVITIADRPALGGCPVFGGYPRSMITAATIASNDQQQTMTLNDNGNNLQGDLSLTFRRRFPTERDTVYTDSIDTFAGDTLASFAAGLVSTINADGIMNTSYTVNTSKSGTFKHGAAQEGDPGMLWDWSFTKTGGTGVGITLGLLLNSDIFTGDIAFAYIAATSSIAFNGENVKLIDPPT